MAAEALSALSAPEIVRLLDLQPHPEGGHFRETFRDTRSVAGRGCSTAIYYLLAEGERSKWHRVDATEVWHHYCGAPMQMTLSPDGEQAERHQLGTEFQAGQRPQIVVPRDYWQSAESLGAWTLIGCTVAPAFEFAGFEMAPPDFNPGNGTD